MRSGADPRPPLLRSTKTAPALTARMGLWLGATIGVGESGGSVNWAWRQDGLPRYQTRGPGSWLGPDVRSRCARSVRHQVGCRVPRYAIRPGACPSKPLGRAQRGPPSSRTVEQSRDFARPLPHRWTLTDPPIPASTRRARKGCGPSIGLERSRQGAAGGAAVA